jgi:hypothetical protein
VEALRATIAEVAGPTIDHLRRCSCAWHALATKQRATIASLREQVRVLSEASLDLAGVALDRRAPADRSDQGRRP